jgi:hypothetical protein
VCVVLGLGLGLLSHDLDVLLLALVVALVALVVALVALVVALVALPLVVVRIPLALSRHGVGARPSALCVTQKFKKNILLKRACQNYFLFSLYFHFIYPLLTLC